MQRFFAIGLGSALLLGVIASVPAQDLKGIVKKFDLETGVLVVKPFGADRPEELSLASRDIVVSNAIGQPAKLSDLQVGSRVVLKLTNDFVTAVKIDGPALWGTLRKIDVPKRTLHLEDPVRTHVVTVPETAKVFNSGEPISLDDLRVGQAVQVSYTPDEKTVLQVTTGKGVGTRDPHRKFVRLRILLLEVDAPGKVLSVVAHPYTEPMSFAKLTISPDLAVRLQFHFRDVCDGTLAEVRGPLNGTAIVDDEAKRVEAVELDLPIHSRRRLVEVDPAGKSVKLEEGKKTYNLELDPAVKVLQPGGDEGKLTDVQKGQLLSCGLSLDQKRVLVIQILSK